MNILVAAEGAAGVRLLRGLGDRPHRIVGLLTTTDPTTASGVTPLHVGTRAGIATWPAARITEPEFASTVRDLDVDLLLNVHSLHLVPPSVAEATRIGAFNLHPSLLPRHAGLNSVSWAILEGESEHGVTIHRMVERIDAGPIAFQERFAITPEDSALTVSARCTNVGVELMMRLVDTAARDPRAIPAIGQDVGQRAYHGREVPHGGRLQWTWPAARIVRFVRACDYIPMASPWGHPRARIGEQEIGIAKARLTGDPSGAPPGAIFLDHLDSIRVAAADEWVSVDLLAVDGGYVHASEFVAVDKVLTDV